jgi:hypothetical protein
MRNTTINKFHELRYLFCSQCERLEDNKVCTEINNLQCIESCLHLASTYSDILEGKFYDNNPGT